MEGVTYANTRLWEMQDDLGVSEKTGSGGAGSVCRDTGGSVGAGGGQALWSSES